MLCSRKRPLLVWLYAYYSRLRVQMKLEEVPQEEWIKGFGTRARYAEDAKGKYVPVPSKGWEVEMIVNAQALSEIEQRIEKAKQEVLSGNASPLKYYMERCQMDAGLLAENCGFWKWRVKQHLVPKYFNRLTDAELQKYADALRIDVEDFNNIPEKYEMNFNYKQFLPKKNARPI